MKILVSLFVSDESMELNDYSGTEMQLAFYKRKTFWNFDHYKFLKRLKEHDIVVESIHAPAADVYHQANNEFVNMLRKIKEIYAVKTITIHPQRGEKRQAKSSYKKLAKEIEALDIILAYETFEEQTINKKWISQLEDMHHYFEVLKFSFLGITYDFTHSTYDKNIREVTKYYHKIKVIHLSDALRNKPLDKNEYHQHLPLGKGNYRVTEFIDLLIKIRYSHYIVLEYHSEYSSCLKPDAAALKKYIAGDKQELLNIIACRQKGISVEDR
jgi:sugar phosphate isomerase/epimerase